VVRRLATGGPLPASVRVIDYGIRGMHLAYDLLDGWDTLILVDALPPAAGPPATLPAATSKRRLASARPRAAEAARRRKNAAS